MFEKLGFIQNVIGDMIFYSIPINDREFKTVMFKKNKIQCVCRCYDWATSTESNAIIDYPLLLAINQQFDEIRGEINE